MVLSPTRYQETDIPVGHDVCADLAKHGVDVTMVQRSPTHIMSNASIRRAIALYAEDGPPTDIADRLTASLQTPLAITLSTGIVEENKANDKYAPLMLTFCDESGC